MAQIVLETVSAEPSNAVMVGDRLATDIAMGVTAGMDTALVLTGDSGRDEVARLPESMRPTYVLERLSELLPER